MNSSNLLLTLAVIFSLHGFILGLTCLTCKDCDKETEVPVGQECRENNVYCISFVDGFEKIIKRCGTQQECGRVVNPSVGPNQFFANMESFVNGSMGYAVATLDESSFRHNDSYCCDSDLCNSQTLNLGKYEVETSGAAESLEKGENQGPTVDGGIVNISNFLEGNIEYSIGYNSPILRSRSNHNTTTSVNSGVGELRSMKRSPDAAGEGNPADEGDEKFVTEVPAIPNEETTFLTHIYSESSSISAEALDSSTVVKPTDSQEKVEAVSSGLILHSVGKYILIIYAILYIF